MNYVDGFVLVVPKTKVSVYQKIAKIAGKVWREQGALQYFECVGDDLKTDMGMSFPKLAKLKPNETVVFAWIVYKNKSHRDSVNKKVMKIMHDPDFAKKFPKEMPFDIKRMSYGGFKVLVRA